MPVPAKILFLVLKLPLGNPIAGKALALRVNHLFMHQVAQAGVGGNLPSQAKAWERDNGGMRCAFPPHGLFKADV
jgi:hypothetical protein